MTSMSSNATSAGAAPPDAARQAALDWLFGRINFERTAIVHYQARQLKLDRMRQLLTRLGQPDSGLKIIHVAGTKGKGSTATMIAAMLTAAGYRTGLFSSPHLERIEERFVIDGQPCTAEELATLINRVRAEVAVLDDEAAADGDLNGGPTYFEITTAVALLHFVERHADAVVLEVGLGGRLDATNVCLPVVSVITSISFDHMRQLGNTLAAIAREKAGIIKPGVPVICGVTDAEPQWVIADMAREHGCRLIQIDRDFHVNYHAPKSKEQAAGPATIPCSADPQLASASFHQADSAANAHCGAVDFAYAIAGQEFKLSSAALFMHGAHQATNAAIALATLAELRHQGWCISSDAMRHGLSRAVLPGRVEVRPGDPLVILDTAHNPASARALVAALGEFPQPTRRTLIVSISYDKDVKAIVRELVPHFQRIIVTQYQENPRAVPAVKLTALVRQQLTGSLPQPRHDDRRTAATSTTESIAPQQGAKRAVELLTCIAPGEAWLTAIKSAEPGETICVAGSFFLAAELRPLIFDCHVVENFAPAMRL